MCSSLRYHFLIIQNVKDIEEAKIVLTTSISLTFWNFLTYLYRPMKKYTAMEMMLKDFIYSISNTHNHTQTGSTLVFSNLCLQFLGMCK